MYKITQLFVVFCLVMLCEGISASQVAGQSNSGHVDVKPGQSLYIVGFRQAHPPLVVDSSNGTVGRPEAYIYELDVEQKIRSEIKEWGYFKIVDKASESEVVLLVDSEDSSMEGLLIPQDAFKTHFKDKFDIDALREAALGRYLVGPLKVASLGRLSDRLVKEMKQKISGK